MKPFCDILCFFHNSNHESRYIAITHRANHKIFKICKLSLKYQAHTASNAKDVIIRILTNARLESAYFNAANIHNGIIKSNIPAGIATSISFCVTLPSQNIR
jgi:hypothetical protein